MVKFQPSKLAMRVRFPLPAIQRARVVLMRGIPAFTRAFALLDEVFTHWKLTFIYDAL
jgi:hypothetical protein